MYPIMEKKIIPYHASFFLNAIWFLGFYIKNSIKKHLIKNILLKLQIQLQNQFLTIIKLTYTGIK